MTTRRGGFYLDQVFAEALRMDFKSVSGEGGRGGAGKKRSRGQDTGEDVVGAAAAADDEDDDDDDDDDILYCQSVAFQYKII